MFPRFKVITVISWLALGTILDPAQACMNEYRPNLAAIERSESLHQMLTVRRTVEPWVLRRDRLRELVRGGDFRVKNDLAAALVHTGEAKEAVTLLQQIEAEKPGLYFTAANLGTAYELVGNVPEALRWIRRGIELNPEAHDGTEWLHVRILEAKLAMKDAPGWLESHSVLTGAVQAVAKDGIADVDATGNRGEILTGEQLKSALIYQLHERLQFVAAPDPLVGALLSDLAALVGREAAGIGGAESILKLASSYLASLPADHPLRLRVAKAMIPAEAALRGPHSSVAPVGWIPVGLVLLGGAYFLYRAIRRFT